MRNEYGEHSIIRYIGIAAITASMLLPLAASAASVQVYPTITNAHGGTKFAADMTSCIAYDATSQCAQSVPTFTVPDGSTYSVTIQPAAGYSYTLDNNCSGVAQGDIICNVAYNDGAPIPPPAAPAPTPAPQPAPEPTPAPIVQTPTPQPTQGISSPAATPERPDTVTVTVSASSTATSTPEQVQTQISLLQKLIVVLQQLIALLIAQQQQ